MKNALVPLFLLMSWAASAPLSKEDKLKITADFFPEELVIYTGKHDIVNIVVPLNGLNFQDSENSNNTDDDDNATFFFVEADIKENGEKEYKGLYIRRNGKITKLLDDGTDIAVDSSRDKTAYFSAKDGIYSYDVEKNEAKKYGSVTHSLIGIAEINGTDVFYVLTEANKVFKVTEEGTKSTPVDEINYAKEITVDLNNTLYYLDKDNKVHVVNENGVKTIEGLPENPVYARIIRPPFIFEDGIPVIVDNVAYIVYSNGTSELSDIEFEVKPTAYGMEATLIQYMGYDKKIYEYNILAILLGPLLEALQEFLSEMKDNIESLSKRPSSSFLKR